MRTNRIKILHKIAEQTIMEPIVMRVLQHLCKEDHTQEAQLNRIADRTTVRGISNQQPLSHLPLDRVKQSSRCDNKNCSDKALTSIWTVAHLCSKLNNIIITHLIKRYKWISTIIGSCIKMSNRMRSVVPQSTLTIHLVTPKPMAPTDTSREVQVLIVTRTTTSLSMWPLVVPWRPQLRLKGATSAHLNRSIARRMAAVVLLSGTQIR